MIKVDELLDTTATSVGLDDYGDPTFRGGLDRLVASAEAEADLTDIGWGALRAQVTGALTNRLRVIDWVKEHPEVATAPVTAPLFIVGQPRTGTTALSHLLGADPGNRSLLHWEAGDSIPPPATATYHTDPRFEAARVAPNPMAQLNPDFMAIHYDPPEAPIECVVLLAQHFMSLQYSAVFHVPSYDEWLLETDNTPAYRYHRLVLQVLQSACPGQWQLKSPHHQLGIEALATVYPDAQLVWTHRDPVNVIGSLISLTRSLHGTFTDVDHVDQLRTHWMELAATLAERMMAYRDRVGDAAFCDLSYRQLVQDPVGAVRAVYEQFGRELTPEAERAIAAHAAEAPQHKHGKHTYSIADYGITEDQVRDRFAAYLDRYGDLV